MVIFSDCKINLGLYVTGVLPNGYHSIETVMVHVPWHDVIEIVPTAAETTLKVLGRQVDCPPEKNLVMKAYRALGDLPPVEIILQKNIPDGAGLGGGSADAAYTLRLLNRMFDLGHTDAELASIASDIGADCPFFVYDRTMLCTGTGTDMTAVDVDLAGKTILIVKPGGVSISTAEAYRGVDSAIAGRPTPTALADAIRGGRIEDYSGLSNDFELSIFPIAPQVARVKAAMLASGAAYASMSGSGAAVYGLFDSESAAEACRRQFSGCDTFVHRF